MRKTRDAFPSLSFLYTHASHSPLVKINMAIIDHVSRQFHIRLDGNERAQRAQTLLSFH